MPVPQSRGRTDTPKCSVRYVIEYVIRFTCFLSHDWGQDGEGRSTHERVLILNERLKAAGMVTWCDTDRMRGDINAAMTDGIDRSQIVLIFVTRNYMVKAAGLGVRGLGDNVYAEFSYALNRRGVERMIAVVMEPACRDTSQWHGAVGLRLGSCLYVDLSMDARANPRGFDAAMEGLVKEARSRLGQTESGRPNPPSSSAHGSSNVEMHEVGLDAEWVEEATPIDQRPDPEVAGANV